MRALVLAGSAAALSGCGQKGPLLFPQGPAAANRATLVETLKFRVTGDPQQRKAASGTPAAPTTSAAPATPPTTEQSYDLMMVPESTMPSVTAPHNTP
ncbi:LPS translocon maturation chaperone LptM [Xylophilus ampelinus]|uniref:LPS translocon maturation chaperone LptM n=1 Tax=Xylophilus ampelinus TaxID=54067 RepID=UPI001F484373|nr:lipoprotein [Xylophilus ampelinus]MCS4510098.1 lipoprotein [Xylophilus ampelinus]